MKKVCPCGKEFDCQPARFERSRCCSKECQYKYARRPAGLTYDLKIVNKAWFTSEDARAHHWPKGYRASPGTEIKKGQRLSPRTEFKRGQVPHNFKGDEVGYYALHARLYRQYGRPVICERCSSDRNVCWASKDWSYTRERSAWWALCQKCHSKYDKEHAWGVASTLYPELRK